MASTKALVYRELKRRLLRDIKRRTVYYDTSTDKECAITAVKTKDGKINFVQVESLDGKTLELFFHFDYFKARFVRKERMAVKLDL